MIWAALSTVGVPLWLCAVAIVTLGYRNRELRSRPGDVVVRVRRPRKRRWTRAHAIWVSDVFVWRGSPAAWAERVKQVTAATLRAATPDELARLHRLGPAPAVMTMTSPDGETFDVATRAEQRNALLGPFSGDRYPSSPEIGRAR